MIRIFIADDHAIVRAGIRQLLATAADIAVVGEAGDGRRVLSELEHTPCDVLLLDLSLPIVNGAEVLKRVKAAFAHVRVLVLSMYSEAQYARRLLAAGASGYLSKDRSEEELLDAIRQVASGRTYITSVVAEQSVTGPRAGGAAPHETLSPREHDVFALLVQGRTVSEISAELDLGGSTVSTHVARIKAKLGAHSIAEIVSYAHRAGLAE